MDGPDTDKPEDSLPDAESAWGEHTAETVATGNSGSDRWKSWLRGLVACNPFYLLSAVLLLFGINRLSVDPGFLAEEGANLAFNFWALEVYEALLIGVATLLARRLIWYDSLLLVAIDQVLVLVPFILLTHSVLIGQAPTLFFGLAASVLAVARYTTLRGQIRMVPGSWSLLLMGAALLGMNLLAPFYYRSVIEVGTDAWAPFNQWGWLALLPVLVAGANLLPRAGSASELNRVRLGLLIFSLWITGSAVHLYCISYVTEVPFYFAWLTPMLWSGAWTAWNRRNDLVSVPTVSFNNALLVIPVLLPVWSALAGDLHICFALSAANVLIYLGLSLSRFRQPLMSQLSFVSLAVVIASWPWTWAVPVATRLDRLECLIIGVAVYVILNALASSQPFHGFCAALAIGIGANVVTHGAWPQLAWYAGFGALTAHSLRWPELGAGRRDVRKHVIAAIWGFYGFVWSWAGGQTAGWLVASTALAMLGWWGLNGWLEGNRRSWAIPIAATVSLLGSPIHGSVGQLKSLPAGLLYVLGSFLFLGAGTFLAFNRHRRASGVTEHWKEQPP